MSKTILFLLTFLPTLIFGQQTKKIVDKDNNEVYYVLKSDKSKRHGNYQKFGDKNELLINGFFKNGVKDSIWEFYSYGILQQKYDYTKNELIFYLDEFSSKEGKYRVGSDTTPITLERPPIYLGGSRLMFESIFKNIKYPKDARENGKSGKVYIVFTVDKNGKTVNHRVKKGIGYGCDEEALRTVKLIPDNWIPGILNGQTVDVEFVMPINFNLQ